MVRVIKQWSRLTGEVVNALSLEILKARLDKALSNLLYLKKSLLVCQGVVLHDLFWSFPTQIIKG